MTTTTSVTTSLPLWLAGGVYDSSGGNDLRNSSVTAMFYDQGIVAGAGETIGVLGGVLGGAGLLVAPGTGMTITVQPGSFVVPNSASPVAGGYVSTLAAQATLSVQTADPSNPRIDIVVANVVDNGNSSSYGEVQIITGIAASSPSAPAAPPNSITLAQVQVPAAATSIVAGNITGTRPFTVAAGGVLVAPKGTVVGYEGQLAWDQASGSFYHNANSVDGTPYPVQARMLPFAPAHVIGLAPVTLGSGVETLLSATVNTDGNTDLKISWRLAQLHAASACEVVVYTELDGNTLEYAGQELQASTYNMLSGVIYTSSAAGTTPSAASHTITLRASGSGATINSADNSSQGMYLRVEPVGL